MLDLTIAVTTYNEPQTIGRCLNSILSQKLPKSYEILVSCPDKPTINIIKEFIRKNHKIKLIKDPGKGKPTALNIILRKARGKIIVFMDGDTILKKDSIKILLKHFGNKNIGAVTGRRIEKSYNAMLNNWFEMTGNMLHRIRTEKSKSGSFYALTGSPHAIRNGIIKEMPTDALVDDILLGLMIKQKGYKIIYEPNAAIFGVLPGTIKDFIRQVARSQAGLYQIKERYKLEDVSSIRRIDLINELLKTKGFKRKIDCLIVGTIYILATFYGNILIRKNVAFSKIWKPIPSTKIAPKK